MRFRTHTLLVAFLCLCLTFTASWADLGSYQQDFEALDQTNVSALADDGWLVFANVFTGGGIYLYGYGPFPAPNDGGPGFCAIDTGQGDIDQGLQQLSVYSDYNNIDHGNGNVIEANTFQEQIVGAADVGSTWLFQFDAKRGNIELGSQAAAFIKTLDPNAGFALTNLISADMTNIPDTWNNYLLSIYIDPSLDGQILQFGFLNTATNYEGSGVFYDNINFRDLTNQCPSDDGEDDTETDDSESGDLFLGSDSIVGSTDSGLLDLNFNHEVSNEQNTTTGNVERDRAKRRGR